MVLVKIVEVVVAVVVVVVFVIIVIVVILIIVIIVVIVVIVVGVDPFRDGMRMRGLKLREPSWLEVIALVVGVLHYMRVLVDHLGRVQVLIIVVMLVMLMFVLVLVMVGFLIVIDMLHVDRLFLWIMIDGHNRGLLLV